jgi:hypothetical protein
MLARFRNGAIIVFHFHWCSVLYRLRATRNEGGGRIDNQFLPNLAHKHHKHSAADLSDCNGRPVDDVQQLAQARHVHALILRWRTVVSVQYMYHNEDTPLTP